MRGERVTAYIRMGTMLGSSPHARGTPAKRLRRNAEVRIIPACAGNAKLRRPIGTPFTDHPRMRGERRPLASSLRENPGSSPHARGTRDGAEPDAPARRIIPACAGNALRDRSAAAFQSDHPRMRGERASTWDASAVLAGSSPHARGTRSRSRQRIRSGRIIPACAGNAVAQSSATTGPTDHPRMRGERPHLRRLVGVEPGSSPHARGTHVDRPDCRHVDRIIPACAGNATVRCTRTRCCTDHPRMRGERARTT